MLKDVANEEINYNNDDKDYADGIVSTMLEMLNATPTIPLEYRNRAEIQSHGANAFTEPPDSKVSSDIETGAVESFSEMLLQKEAEDNKKANKKEDKGKKTDFSNPTKDQTVVSRKPKYDGQVNKAEMKLEKQILALKEAKQKAIAAALEANKKNTELTTTIKTLKGDNSSLCKSISSSSAVVTKKDLLISQLSLESESKTKALERLKQDQEKSHRAEAKQQQGGQM